MAQAQTRAPRRSYETIFIMKPDVDKATSEGLSSRLKEVVTRGDGKLTRVENWGRRKLAYPVQKHSRGVYVYLGYLGGGALVNEIERNLRMVDAVLKYQTIKLDDTPTDVDVSPEDVEFQHAEPDLDEEPEQTIAQKLGLAAPERREREEGRDEGGNDEGMSAKGGDSDEGSASASSKDAGEDTPEEEEE